MFTPDYIIDTILIEVVKILIITEINKTDTPNRVMIRHSLFKLFISIQILLLQKYIEYFLSVCSLTSLLPFLQKFCVYHKHLNLFFYFLDLETFWPMESCFM